MESDSPLVQIGINKIGSSIFSRLIANAKSKDWDNCFIMLHKQARMHKEIQGLANFLFYNNNLETREEFHWQIEKYSQYSINSQSEFLKKILSSRLVFVNTRQEFDSKRNLSEAKFIRNFITRLFEEMPNAINQKTVGVISPFRLQCAEILRSVPQKFQDFVSIDTVERFQGSERDIILFSYSSNYNYELEMSSDIELIENQLIDRKLNVAITRAREHLIILGCQRVLDKSLIHKKLINYIKYNGLIMDISEIENKFEKNC